MYVIEITICLEVLQLRSTFLYYLASPPSMYAEYTRGYMVYVRFQTE